MLFNSYEYLIFLPTVFLLYWYVFSRNIKARNIFLLLVSYIFYGWWDWRFLGLIAASSAVDYWCGLRLAVNSPDSYREQLPVVRRQSADAILKPFQGRNLYLTLSLLFNLGLLGFFKYFNFFIESTSEMLQTLGFQANLHTLNLILPVGISFYTFQTLSYTIDVYRGKMEATKDPIAFFAYVSFFPQLVAGPIERASNLLPQFFQKKVFDYQQGTTGLKLILWGLFKKIVIADNCAQIVNPIFENYTHVSGLELVFGAILFAFQIYGDFSGYSDIAIGTGKLLGFDLMANFRTPYFSRDIGEFWRRWHISLSSWFKDYVYIPLGGSRGSKLQNIRNIFIIFLVSGFWHGANWTFLAWGGLNAFLFIPVFISRRNRIHLEIVAKKKLFPSLKEITQMLITFIVVCIAWVFFRSETLYDAFGYLASIFENIFFPFNYGFIDYDVRLMLIVFIMLEWLSRSSGNWLLDLPKKKWRYIVYFIFSYLIIFWGVFSEPIEFIYFQF